MSLLRPWLQDTARLTSLWPLSHSIMLSAVLLSQWAAVAVERLGPVQRPIQQPYCWPQAPPISSRRKAHCTYQLQLPAAHISTLLYSPHEVLLGKRMQFPAAAWMVCTHMYIMTWHSVPPAMLMGVDVDVSLRLKPAQAG